MRSAIKWLALLLSLTLIAGCAGGSKGSEIQVASTTYTEQHILAEIVKQYVESKTDLTVKLKTGLGASSVVHAAMVSNEAQVAAARYVGTELTGVLNVTEAIRDPEAALKRVKDGLQEKFNQTYFDPYGFENTYAFAVRKETAEKYHLKRISDLKAVADTMNLGVDTTWLERAADGYKAFTEAYGITFGKTTPMDIGLVYKALNDNQMDIVLAYSTDARIKQFDLVVLEDDKHFFPPYQAAPTARTETLEKYPELKTALQDLAGKISTAEMTDMNYAVDVEGKEPAAVAKAFLQQKGMIK